MDKIKCPLVERIRVARAKEEVRQKIDKLRKIIKQTPEDHYASHSAMRDELLYFEDQYKHLNIQS